MADVLHAASLTELAVAQSSSPPRRCDTTALGGASVSRIMDFHSRLDSTTAGVTVPVPGAMGPYKPRTRTPASHPSLSDQGGGALARGSQCWCAQGSQEGCAYLLSSLTICFYHVCTLRRYMSSYRRYPPIRARPHTVVYRAPRYGDSCGGLQPIQQYWYCDKKGLWVFDCSC